MKKSIFSGFISFSLLSLIFIQVSCSNSQDSKLVYTESNTIKQSVQEKGQDISWTNEIEAQRLSQVINRNSMTLGPEVPYSKELYKISNQNNAPVYPSISDFGSLDTSTLKSTVRDKLNNFCEAFSSRSHNGADSYFSRKYIFNYVFFKNDFEAEWESNFREFKSEDEKLFTKWIFGEPFIGPDIIQIPVRFYTDCGTIDVTVFMNSNGNNEFYQITIDRWNKV